jgi:copper chaperone
MTCGGCSGAVTRALKKYQENNVGGGKHEPLHRLKIAYFEPVSSFDVKLETQEVVVTGKAPYDDVLAVIKKTGKEVSIIRTPRPFRVVLI